MAAEEIVDVVVVDVVVVVVVVVMSLSIFNNVLGCTELKKIRTKNVYSLSNVSNIQSIEAVLVSASIKIPGLCLKLLFSYIAYDPYETIGLHSEKSYFKKQLSF